MNLYMNPLPIVNISYVDNFNEDDMFMAMQYADRQLELMEISNPWLEEEEKEQIRANAYREYIINKRLGKLGR